MLRPAGNAPNKMTNSLKIEFALHFPINHRAHKRGLALLLGSSTAF
jgi:hypothetical protein